MKMRTNDMAQALPRPSAFVGLCLALTAPANAQGIVLPDALTVRGVTRGPLDPVASLGADLDGDGDQDVLTVSGLDGGIALYENLGAGSFAPATIPFGPERRARTARAGDLDGDGDQDVVLVLADEVVIWRNGGAAPGWSRESVSGGSFDGAADLRFAELNGDGELDIVLRFGAEVGWLPSSGPGTYGAYQMIGAVTSRGVEVIDANGDGWLDVMGERSGPVTTWFESGGAGAFIPRSVTHGFDAGTLLDANQDGVVDLLLADLVTDFISTTAQVHWREGTGAGGFAPAAPTPTSLTTLCTASFGDVASVQLRGRPDRNLDGVGEFVLECDCGATFLDVHEPASTGALQWQSASFLFAQAPVQHADLDGDGDLDRLELSTGADWRALDASGSYGAPASLAVGAGGNLRPLAIDLNRDGWLDVVASVDSTVDPADAPAAAAIFYGQGLGRFDAVRGAGAPQPVGFNGQSPIVGGDFDGDGDPDLAYYVDSEHFVWLETDAAGMPGVGRRVGTGPTDISLGSLAVIDLNQDGIDDVVSVARDGGNIIRWRADGGGAFTRLPLLPSFDAHRARTLDFDRDGDDDLLVAGFHFVEVRLNDGAEFARTARVAELGIQDFAAGDLDGDGDVDIVTASTSKLAWHRNDAPSGLAPASTLDPQTASLGALSDSVEVADLDGDGFNDVIHIRRLSAASAPVIKIYPGSPTGPGAPTSTETAIGSGGLVAADLDADGDPDLVGASANQVAWFENRLDPLMPIGRRYCTPAIPNSTGTPAALRARGSAALAQADITLLATSLPRGSAGYFLASQTQALTSPVTGSLGTLCLGGSIGRYVGPGQIQNSGTEGEFQLQLDLASIPTPVGPVQALPGTTWNFQAWYRDANPAVTSNFTDAVSITFE